ncbi:pyridoxal-phosphate dependent enzyme [Tenacibaculum finnmarkense genomovar finnmarkense]|uniref:pyridoxal-phosphate dependent enzyme n=1 Tax=Tenacibaculum finnmarkense TaxID=2781243 RepID=UPI001E5B9C58|nr:pyridoxal-phosphate dependent enzyme [Tenacibaculum finnmarkense]MCD8416884.1 pyridoxal-phosphate dependent enzyme [Tenacibaculum finnmarkense genomovar finnmarkense]MCG8185477.1 pyridoxal-phosphate dependent enzyme [Tenacibaculum finnmarkense genomovar finnmarkense]MCG8209390.1 pyridoxal-phosphate dependent enzyme [Tenacibaculum finnmarkense genomovar finnmarkense]MCG8212186.1 pyridoxal-phosphate dependent enzyme [Tenacibaculum finnmarkense genomovar finnmarkense]MCG8219398.1 pyridoxal-pho
MKYAKNILETIGNTPLVQLNSVTKEIDALVLAKVETFNPGNSIKDRMAVKMIEDAEADGRLKPGGIIIEGTSGNTGMGLALAAIIKGYKCIFVLSDKQSKEKMDILRAVGAQVIVCPTNVEPEDPRSYYSVSKRLGAETPNSWYVNQYDNPSNALTHYEQTGPEIWEQTEGKITHLVVGVGTGGTISGTSKYLKEQNPNIKVWGIDTYGSVFKKYHETGVFDENEIYPYITEGIGEDILPKNVDFSVIDGFTKVTDKDAAVYTRKIAKEEGIFVGNSAGSAIKGMLQLKEHFKKDDVVVVIFHDHGSRYVGKMFNDDWMRERGYLDKEVTTAEDLIKGHLDKALVSVQTEELVSHAIERMRAFKISQIPVRDANGFVGSIDESDLLHRYIADKNIADTPIKDIMGAMYPMVKLDASIDAVSKLITKENQAVLVDLGNGKHHIITKYDIISAI